MTDSELLMESSTLRFTMACVYDDASFIDVLRVRTLVVACHCEFTTRFTPCLGHNEAHDKHALREAHHK